MRQVIFLTVSLLLTSCAMKPLPIDNLYPIDVPHGVCTKFVIVNKDTLEVDPKGVDQPLQSCDGFIAIDKNEYLKFKSWLADMIAKAKKKASRAKNEVQSADLKQDFEAIEHLDED